MIQSILISFLSSVHAVDKPSTLKDSLTLKEFLWLQCANVSRFIFEHHMHRARVDDTLV